jgi:hypothetical protein
VLLSDSARGGMPFAGHSGAKIRQKCGTILFRFNSEISLTQMQPPDLILESLRTS